MKINTNKDNLEKALGNLAGEKPQKDEKMVEMPKETEIGFHQGALNTLVAERNELVKMIGNIEAIMQAHLKRLEELGVKIQTEESKE